MQRTRWWRTGRTSETLTGLLRWQKFTFMTNWSNPCHPCEAFSDVMLNVPNPSTAGGTKEVRKLAQTFSKLVLYTVLCKSPLLSDIVFMSPCRVYFCACDTATGYDVASLQMLHPPPNGWIVLTSYGNALTEMLSSPSVWPQHLGSKRYFNNAIMIIKKL